jgi:large repetitive protein
VASFTVNPPSGTVPLTVFVTSTSTGVIDSQSWDLDGNGVFGDATGPTATQTFDTVGTHTVGLLVTGPGGSSTTTQTVPTTLPPPPVAMLSVQPSSGIAPLQVAFNGCQSTGVITTFEWDFDSNGVVDLTGPCTATHMYAAPGTYTVTLLVTGPGGTMSAAQNIIVSPPPPAPPVVNITAPANGSSFVGGNAVTFAGTATDVEDGDLSSSIRWVSDRDGVFGVGASIQVSNLSLGTHTITAAVTDSSALTANDQITITITPPPPFQPVLTASPLAGSAPLVVTFDACQSTGVTSFMWDFDGDGVEDQRGPCRVQHTYSQPGTYTATGTVRGSGAGETHTEAWQIQVSPPEDECIPPTCDPRM